MRTIKFRGVRKQSPRWVYGDIETSPQKGYMTIHTYDEDGFYERAYIVDPASVGQFTGLHDKNDTPIYEGDIITAVRDVPLRVFYDENSTSFKVTNEHESDWSMSLGDLAGTVTVIGNVYDSPDLLEGGAQ